MARMIFILSSERSGSTLLSAVLGQHPRIVAPAELWLLAFETYIQWRTTKKIAVASLVEFFERIDKPLGSEQIDAHCRGFTIPQVYDWLLSHLDKDTFLVDKTPGYANDRSILERAERFEPLYVWLVRHPLGVVDSKVRLLARGPKYQGPSGVFRRLQDALSRRLDRGMTVKGRKREYKWARQNRNIMGFLDSVPQARWTRVVFEDFVRRPEPITRRLCDFCRIDHHPAMTTPDTSNRVMPPGLGNPNFHTRSAIVPDTALAWTARYREEALQPETQALMDAIGMPRLSDLINTLETGRKGVSRR